MAQASYFILPSMSKPPGRLPLTSPALACLYSEYNLSKVLLSGRLGELLGVGGGLLKT